MQGTRYNNSGATAITGGFWKQRRVFLTGHTGFKGGWLALWLKQAGALVAGYSLPPPTNPSIFDRAGLADLLDASISGDVCDLGLLKRAMTDFAPDVVIHLAAQAVVLSSFEDPVGTFATNVMGTVNVLEAARHTATARAVLIVTSDKCYQNCESGQPRRESDPMGGDDPYSASKAGAELVTYAYRHSFYRSRGDRKRPATIVSARAGNVIGGGDFAIHRLIPDLVRGALAGHPVSIRNPAAIRPWQHVLEPVSGYLKLIERAWEEGDAVAEGWNFGPIPEDVRSVAWIANHFADLWGVPRAEAWTNDNRSFPQEKLTLQIDSSKAAERLGWRPRWTIEQAMERVVDWYRREAEGQDARELVMEQIDDYIRCAPKVDGARSDAGTSS
jgi:CDP-glucose 4,6-dehydratase